MAEQKRVMISSTVRDLPDHRKKVQDACMGLGMFYPDMMEHLTAVDANALEVSIEIVNRAELYVGVFGFRYGYVPDGQTISITEAEYNRAVERDIPRLIFLMANSHPVLPGDIETGDGAAKVTDLRARMEKERVVGFFESADDLKAKVTQALIPFLDSRVASSQATKQGPQTLIHSLSTQHEIVGREEECAAILEAMSDGQHRVYAFAAPGGFGKTALLTKLVKMLSPDGATPLEKLSLSKGTDVDVRVSALLHVDCRNEVKLSALFGQAGRLIGQEDAFDAIYNTDASLTEKLQEIFSRLSATVQNRIWFVFDNFESMLNENSEVTNLELRAFFSTLFAGDHKVRALTVAREVPKFSPRERPFELATVGARLFDGLPLDDCLEFLRKNGATKGLTGSTEVIDSVLKEFAERVHRIPLALVWAVGYLVDTGFTLKQVIEKDELFADFDKGQTKEAERYEDKGLKRLHYEQLKIQPQNSVPILHLLAFFKRAVPKGALVHLLDELELNKTLTRLERNKLITRKESSDAYTRYLNDALAVNLHGLHPIICENEFFVALPNKESLYETAANEYWRLAFDANKVNRFAYAIELYDCAEMLFEYLTSELDRSDLRNSYAAMLMNKGIALWSLTRLGEALSEYDKAIAILELLVIEERQPHLANNLARAYLNKGNALCDLTRLGDALAEYEKAIVIRERLVIEEQQTHLANDLARAYICRGTTLWNLTRLGEALTEFDKAISILERLVYEEHQTHLANDLAGAIMNKAIVLGDLSRLGEALAEYDKAIAIRERLVNVEQQTHLANALANAYVNKGLALWKLTRLGEALTEYDKAIAILDRLVKEEQQTQLANALAHAYMNKGIALSDLNRLREALTELDKAIAILDRLVNEEQQSHLAYDLATAYMNMAIALDRESDFDEALSHYVRSLQAMAFCTEELSMFWIMPALLETLRSRLMALLKLERWLPAARDILQFRSLLDDYVNNDTIDAGLKEAAAKELEQMISVLRGLAAEQRELLYAELGEEADAVRSLVESE